MKLEELHKKRWHMCAYIYYMQNICIPVILKIVSAQMNLEWSSTVCFSFFMNEGSGRHKRRRFIMSEREWVEKDEINLILFSFSAPRLIEIEKEVACEHETHNQVA